MKETGRQGGRQDTQAKEESVCGKANGKLKTRGRRKCEVRGRK